MMNRRVTFAVVFVMIVLAPGAWGQANPQAEERDRLDLAGLARGPAIVGGGLFFGEPSGFTGKLWFPETGFAVDTLLAWSLEDTGRLYVHANGIYHLALIETDGGRYISPSIGLGVLGRIGSEGALGVRLPVGLSLFLFPSFPLELFGEISPGIGLFPDTGEEFGVGLGVRFYLPAGSS
ncbi:MAG: hypothetical protein ACLFR8_12840 [Alkalispirochaeta sp.]